MLFIGDFLEEFGQIFVREVYLPSLRVHWMLSWNYFCPFLFWQTAQQPLSVCDPGFIYCFGRWWSFSKVKKWVRWIFMQARTSWLYKPEFLDWWDFLHKQFLQVSGFETALFQSVRECQSTCGGTSLFMSVAQEDYVLNFHPVMGSNTTS